MTPAQKSELLKAWALEAGFDRAGVARLERPIHGDAYLGWLEEGRHAGMEYLRRRLEVRLEPSAVFPGAQSAVCVALQYAPLAGEDEPGGDLWPRVARYARGDDYHELMERRLDVLAKRVVEAFPGTATRRYVDTGPVLERELAAAAGIGVFGKNTLLLHPEAGSWFLIGELFLSLDLAPDPPLADLCGSCTRCLEACPTGALLGPYQLDANRCISYWTIEHRGAFDDQASAAVGEWLFGCDACQEVCPWNAAPPGGDHPELRVPERRRQLDLAGLLTMERDEYVERFRRSPLKRPKLEGLQRNAAAVMGNSGDPRHRDALRAALRDHPSAQVRDAAAQALRRGAGDAAPT